MGGDNHVQWEADRRQNWKLAAISSCLLLSSRSYEKISLKTNSTGSGSLEIEKCPQVEGSTIQGKRLLRRVAAIRWTLCPSEQYFRK